MLRYLSRAICSPAPDPNRLLPLRFSCQVAGGGGVLNGELVGDRTMFLPTGILSWISSSASTVLHIWPVVVLLPVG